MIEHYPEIFRATYTDIVEALTEAGLSPSLDKGRAGEGLAAEISLQVVDWIRRNWGGRTITRIWWQFDTSSPDKGRGEEGLNLPNITIQRDPVKSVKGRELRAAAWSILALRTPPFLKGAAGGICFTASLIAATVESSLSLGVVHLPKASHIDRLQRDQDIWRKFHWLGNIDQIIAKHGLAQSQLYTIKRRIQKEKDLREQPALF